MTGKRRWFCDRREPIGRKTARKRAGRLPANRSAVKRRCQASGTADFLADHGIETVKVLKHYEGRPSIIDHISNGDVQLVINTPIGEYARYDEHIMGQTALKHSVPFFTTLAAAFASLSGIQASRHEKPEVRSLQEYFGRSKHAT